MPHPDGVSLPRDLERPVLHPSALGVPGADLRVEPGARPRGSELSLFNRRRRVARVLELREHGLAARLGQDSCHGGLERVDALAEPDVERLLRRDGALVRRDALLASRDVRLGDARVLDERAPSRTARPMFRTNAGPCVRSRGPRTGPVARAASGSGWSRPRRPSPRARLAGSSGSSRRDARASETGRRKMGEAPRGTAETGSIRRAMTGSTSDPALSRARATVTTPREPNTVLFGHEASLDLTAPKTGDYTVCGVASYYWRAIQ